MKDRRFRAITIGTSAGGVEALNKVLRSLPPKFQTPIIVILHLGEGRFIPGAFFSPEGVLIKEADEKEAIAPGHVYFAPADYHLLVENDLTFSLTVEEKVQFARPSIDVSFECLGNVFGSSLLGILMTGANEDGAYGLSQIKKNGGFTVVQDPGDAAYPVMPEAAIRQMSPDEILSLPEICSLLQTLKGEYGNE